VDPWIDDQGDSHEEEPEDEEGDASEIQGAKPTDLGTLEARLGQVTEAVAQMQKALRVIALGIDYGRYLRFETLTDVDLFHDATHEEYKFCVQFVVDAAFHLADVEANAIPPSWWNW
jgi:hypothetical protein